MLFDSSFIETAKKYFNPYTPSSGTEHVSFLLYSLARMTKPQVIVEYGSGYSTLFVLRALADNKTDYQEEKFELLKKTKELFESDFSKGLNFSEGISPEIERWFDSGGKACGANPEFFLNPYEPHLYSFELLDKDHEYVKNMQDAIKAIGHSDIFTHLTGTAFSKDQLPKQLEYIDWAWNDLDQYREFFITLWPKINPNGGLLIFHNVTAMNSHYEAVKWMINQRKKANKNDLEVLFLEEPHKLNQNGCVILRKTESYSPQFHVSNPLKIFSSLMKFSAQENI